MTEPNEKQPIFLTFQGNILVKSQEEGEAIYNELKTFVKSWGEKPYISGQIIQHMEQCCGHPQKGLTNARIPPFMQRKSSIPFGG